MRKALVALAVAGTSALLLACGSADELANSWDAGAGDGGTGLDAGPTVDAGSRDAGATVDAGSPDAGATPDAGTGDAGTPATSGSCREAAIDSCTDFAGKAAVIVEAKTRCDEALNAWSYAACATANRLGTCTKSDTWTGFGAVTIKCRYYKGDYWTASTASGDCRDFWAGTWSAP